MSVIEDVKARLDIMDVIAETVQLRRSGKNYVGFCPFHQNTRTPSFVVFPETGTWRCFGQCNEGGDVFRFVMKKEGWDFSEALRQLAARAGVELRPQTPQQAEQSEAHDHLRALLEDAAAFYRHHLLNTAAGKSALEYLHRRGLNDAAIEAFGLGYAPQSWDAALSHFKSRGVAESDLLEAGLLSTREAGGLYDRFRHRIMFPIRDERGRLAGFGARILNPEDQPKFLNSPQTPVFDKGRLLYGLERARRAIRQADQAVIVEGYLDVIALHQHGFENAVSPMGTALTEHQLRLLKKLARRFVLALDPDAAGARATLRGLHIARQALDHQSEPTFDARGLLSHEARLQADIRVTTLPEGMDPDDIVHQDPARWGAILEAANPVVLHVMETLVAGQDLQDAKVKSEIASQVLPLIEDLPDSVEREDYRQRLARLLRVDERALISGRPSRPVRPGRLPAAAPAAPPPALLPIRASAALEDHCLGVLLRQPGLLYQVDRALLEAGLGRLAPEDFQRAEYQAILRLLLDSLAQDEVEPLHFVLNGLSQPLMDLAGRLLEKTGNLDPNQGRVLEDLMRALLEMRRRDLNQQIDQLRYMMIEEAQQSGDPKASQYVDSMKHCVHGRQRLDRAIGQYTSRIVSPPK
jgi:DNA primase